MTTQKLESHSIASCKTGETFDVLIIGAGFAGIGAAIRLRQSGIRNIAVLERDTEVGGTWRDNRYPGATCDIPSLLYSYSFAQHPNWSHAYSGSREILGYIRQLVCRFELGSLIHFRRNVEELIWDENRACWQVTTEQGKTYQARSVVMAQGPLSNSSWPAIPGIEKYMGHKIHSARWDSAYDFSGKRVAVIGTGASGIQIIPELVKVAKHVKVFQRTPAWVLPRKNYLHAERLQRLFSRFPSIQSTLRSVLFWIHEVMAIGLIWNSPLTRLLEHIAMRHLRRQVKDRWTRRQLTPDFRIGCKRVLISSDYFPALQKSNCKLLTWPIATLGEHGIRTAEGIEHQVDCIVFATGFDVCNTGTPFLITGRNGRRLHEEWANGAQAYKSVSVSGYPNLFMTFGPNSGPGHNSALVYMESQIDYAVTAISQLLRNGHKLFDLKEQVQTGYNLALQKRLSRTNWNSGCKSWYLTADGYNATMYPGFATQYRKQMRDFAIADYEVVLKETPSSVVPSRKHPQVTR